MSIAVFGAVFVDIKGYPKGSFSPTGRNAGAVEQVHGGVARNIAEDIANCELRPTFVSLVDGSGIGSDVVRKLGDHRVDTRYIRSVPDGLGTWLAVFDSAGDVYASISKRPDLSMLNRILDEQGDEIFAAAQSVIIEMDLDKETVKRILRLTKKHRKPIYAATANMTLTLARRDLLLTIDCFVCNLQEFGILFANDYSGRAPQDMVEIVAERVHSAQIPRLIVTMGAGGSVYASLSGERGYCPARNVRVVDTTGAGDAFCAGASIGLTYGKSLAESCEIGTLLASSVISTTDNVCPRFRPRELGLDVDIPGE